MDSDKKHSYDHDDSSPKGAESPEVATIGGYVPDTDEEKKLLRKIDLYLLPMIFCMYLLSYMDRTK
jgi:hypothetical protein